MKKKANNNGHTLLDELNYTLEDIETRAEDRNQAVEARLRELEDEQYALVTVKQSIASLRN